MDLSHISVGEGVRHRLECALNRLSHAYLICGPAGSDTNALADHLAAAYVCSGEGERPCGLCSGCRKVRENIHPDVIRVSMAESKREITVGQARDLRMDAYIRPNEAPRKVFIIENAQTMNANAQNALLKVLEDGPDYLAFLLLAENPQQLLPTIRSRCETLSLTPRPGEDQPKVDEELRKKAAELAALLMKDDECALVEYTVGLENQKIDKNTLPLFLDEVQEALRPELLRQPRQAAALMERLKQARQAALFNVGSGHLFGWLAAGRSIANIPSEEKP